MNRFSRRTFVLGGLGAMVGSRPGVRGAAAYPFSLGVASGEPAPDSVVLWTRLAPDPLDADGYGGMPSTDVAVEWQVSAAASFATLVASGTVTARRADAHSVHVGAALHDLNHACRYATELIVMRDGAVVAQGPPGEVMTADLVEDVFAMPCKVIDDPETGTPMVVPAGRHRRPRR